MKLSKHEKDFVTPKFEIYVGSNLNYLIRYYEWVILRNHEVYSKYESTLNNISLSNLILQLETYQECQGITLPENQQAIHTVSKKFDFLNHKWSASQNLCNQIFYFWANTCELLLTQIPEEMPVCQSCRKLKIRTASENTWKTKQANVPIKLNVPIKFTSLERLKVTIVRSWLKMSLVLITLSRKLWVDGQMIYTKNYFNDD